MRIAEETPQAAEIEDDPSRPVALPARGKIFRNR
jgi:hypothetical protein